ncbi:Uncharacterized protein PBTT_05285 [Plasmodiophora brassicae]
MSFGVSRGWTWIRSWAQRVSKSDNAVVALGTAGVMLFAVGSYAVINPPRRKRDIELDVSAADADRFRSRARSSRLSSIPEPQATSSNP